MLGRSLWRPQPVTVVDDGCEVDGFQLGVAVAGAGQGEEPLYDPGQAVGFGDGGVEFGSLPWWEVWFEIFEASSIVSPLIISVSAEDDAIALPHPNVSNLAS